MSDALAQLEPRSLWAHFASIAAIPRPSKREEKISAWVRKLAARYDWKVVSDPTGNLILRVPASRGKENAPVTILQAHLDMVCEKNKDVEHDFDKDPIRPRIDGEWVYATGTTLGADNGIGVAAALAAATDNEVVHGPLELLFTVDEETGLTGAAGLDASLLEGRTLLNLDSEDDGKLFVGCAGGADCHLFLEPSRRAPRAGTHPLLVEVKGLRGGHSGIDIHENRGNAIKLLARLLTSAMESAPGLELAELHGGSMHNAIPREAEASVFVDAAEETALRSAADSMLVAFRKELAGVDDGVQVVIGAGQADGQVFDNADRDRLLRLLLVLPHGVLAMSRELPGLVETSSNLAAVHPGDDRLKIVTSSRSSVMPTQLAVLESIRAAARLAGVPVEVHDGYPGWKPNMDSPLLAIVREVYAELWDGPPEVTAIHAGLECGLIGERIEGIDMISFGPEIQGPHSPDERVCIASVDRFWSALTRVLDQLAG